MFNVPNLRFPGFSGEWVEKKLGDLGEIISGLTYSPNDINENGVLVLRSSNVKNNNLVFEDNVFVNTTEYNDVIKDDILLVVRNGSKRLIGKCALITEEYEGVAFGAFMSVFRSDVNKFLIHWFWGEDFKKEVYKNLGATINSINGSNLKKFKLSIPKLQEQQKLASFLTALDKRTQAQIEIIEDYKKLKKGMMQKIFKQEVRFKDEQDGLFSEWEEIKLGNLTNKTGKKNKENIQFPVYSINNKEGFLPQGDQFEGMNSNSRGYDISLYKIIKKNTFAYNPARINVGSIGFSGKLNNIIISSLYVCFKTTNELNDEYLLQYLNTFEFKKSVLRSVEGGVREYLFYENFSIIKIPLPTNKEQQKIASTLSAIDNKITFEFEYLEKLKVQKKYFLQNLFI